MTDDEKRTAIFEKLSEYIGKSVAIKIHTLSGKTIELTGELTWDILNKRDVANSFKIEFAEFYSVDGIYIHPENIDEVKILK
ncbi:MAG: hypothetical protein LUD27_01815 [Clostridia bacterium]|nr:hypothetical protein [Clostridia bacterium]